MSALFTRTLLLGGPGDLRNTRRFPEPFGRYPYPLQRAPHPTAILLFGVMLSDRLVLGLIHLEEIWKQRVRIRRDQR
jgi:hypothetical protein